MAGEEERVVTGEETRGRRTVVRRRNVCRSVFKEKRERSDAQK